MKNEATSASSSPTQPARALADCAFCDYQSSSDYALAVHAYNEHREEFHWTAIDYDRDDCCESCGHARALNGPFKGAITHAGDCSSYALVALFKRPRLATSDPSTFTDDPALVVPQVPKETKQ